MANHETHSVIAGGIESDLHIDSSKYPHPFCSLLQKRAHFDGTVAKLAMRQPFVLFKGLTFQKLCL
ncbi:hypothetical protein AB7Y21_20515, partial [Escherichia coli]